VADAKELLAIVMSIVPLVSLELSTEMEDVEAPSGYEGRKAEHACERHVSTCEDGPCSSQRPSRRRA
jgi:hypothetical protein